MYNHSILIAIVLRSIYTLLDLSHIWAKAHTTSHEPSAMMSTVHMHDERYTHIFTSIYACVYSYTLSFVCVCVFFFCPTRYFIGKWGQRTDLCKVTALINWVLVRSHESRGQDPCNPHSHGHNARAPIETRVMEAYPAPEARRSDGVSHQAGYEKRTGALQRNFGKTRQPIQPQINK